jgi:cytoskeletal protein CcmA (bactofilin family)
MAGVLVSQVDESKIETILGEDIDFEGTLIFQRSLMIKGRFKGEVYSEGELYIGSDAQVEARLTADVILVKGYVKGDISAYARVELFACASVDGDITAPNVIMENGCRFNGICTMETPRETRPGA